MCSLESRFWLSIVDKVKNELLSLNEDIFIPENMDCQLLRFMGVCTLLPYPSYIVVLNRKKVLPNTTCSVCESQVHTPKDLLDVDVLRWLPELDDINNIIWS